MKRTVATLCLALLHCTLVYADFGPPRLASRTARGASADAPATTCGLSLAGRDIVYQSKATNLSGLGFGDVSHVFLYDRRLQSTELISRSSTDAPGNGDSTNASVTSSGSYVVFESKSANLASGDADAHSGIFRRNRDTGKTDLVSLSCAGECTSPSISDDGRYVAYAERANQSTNDVRVRDMLTQSTEVVSVADNENAAANRSYVGFPVISQDGRYVLFSSRSTNLVNGDTNNQIDLFLRDRTGGTTRMVSLSPAGAQFTERPFSMGPGSIAVASNGDVLVAFGIDALADGFTDSVYIRNVTQGTTTLVAAGNGSSDKLRLSADGSTGIFFSTSSDIAADAPFGGTFIFNRLQGTFQTLTVNSSVIGEPISACISQDGSVVGIEQGAVSQIYTREQDQCTEDPNKENPFVCGCGIPDTDTDLDGTFDCQDFCPADPLKTAPLQCGCGTAETGDTDGDGTIDCADGCPTDVSKTLPGGCGCGTAETADTDADGAFDCVDPCVSDAFKVSGGACGCGTPDDDLNANKVVDCLETRHASPRAPKVKISSKTARITMPSVSGVLYQVSYLQKGKKKAIVKTFRSNVATVRRLRRGSYRVTYILIDPHGGKPLKGPKSKTASFKVR